MDSRTIEQLHFENNAYRDLINMAKAQINEYDRYIRANEREIGLQLEDMSRDSGVSAQAVADFSCDLCLGECEQVQSKPIDELLKEIE